MESCANGEFCSGSSQCVNDQCICPIDTTLLDDECVVPKTGKQVLSLVLR